MRKLKENINKYFPKSGLKFVKNKYRIIRGRLKSLSYKGDLVFCPCCEKSFSGFIDFKYSTEVNNESRFLHTFRSTHCPNCYSLPRHRIVCHYLHENMAQLAGQNILMFGAEYSIENWFHINNLSYTSADLFDRTADVQADIQNTFFADESWSLIICNHVLEHVSDCKLALKELRRILKKEGILEITAPTDKSLAHTIENTNELSAEERIKTFGQIDHMRIFGNDFEALLIAAGFQVEVIEGGRLPDKLGVKVGPANYDDNRVYLCKKP